MCIVHVLFIITSSLISFLLCFFANSNLEIKCLQTIATKVATKTSMKQGHVHTSRSEDQTRSCRRADLSPQTKEPKTSQATARQGHGWVTRCAIRCVRETIA